jgi:hypothetical protein
VLLQLDIDVSVKKLLPLTVSKKFTEVARHVADPNYVKRGRFRRPSLYITSPIS